MLQEQLEPINAEDLNKLFNKWIENKQWKFAVTTIHIRADFEFYQQNPKYSLKLIQVKGRGNKSQYPDNILLYSTFDQLLVQTKLRLRRGVND